MNRTYPKILRNRKRRIERRLDPERRGPESESPMMSASNIHFEMAERSRAVNYGGIGAMHLMGQKLGLAEEIDARVQLLKRHLPYHESDHVLNLAYNALLDGLRLEDIELRRNDEALQQQTAKLKEEQRRAEALQQKLDAILDMEMKMIEREQNLPKKK